VIIRGEHTQRDYWYARLLRASHLRPGDRVRTGPADRQHRRDRQTPARSAVDDRPGR
jgi:hypothetical protein